MMKSSLSLRDALLALAMVAIWGTNFVVVKIVLGSLPPLLLAALRFTVVFLPAIFFIPRPGSVRASGSDKTKSVRASGSDQEKDIRASGSERTAKVPWGNLAVYGLSIGVIQFGFLFIAMNGHISPGLASLVVQMQVFFTIGLSVWREGEKVAPVQIGALLISLAGMGVIALHNGHGTTVLGLGLTLVAGLGWAIGNQAAREQARKTHFNMLAYVVWSSVFAAPPLFALAFLLEGPAAILAGIAHAGALTWGIVIWQSLGNTVFGYSVWNRLLSRYSASLVAPLSLLVPVFGIGASWLFLGEPLQTWKIAASLLVLAGLAVNLLWPRSAPPAQKTASAP